MQPTQTNTNQPSFAEKLTKKIQPLTNFDHPTEEQGLIFNHQDGAKIREYLVAIHKLVGGAANIVAASRVSGGRVIIFLASKDLVDIFQQNYGGFQFGNSFITTRKLKAPAIKLVLSNVSPTVPNTVLEKTLKETLKLKLVSPISILRVSPKDDLFSHVVCWRRQVYVQPTEENFTFPSTILLNYAERSYRIFLNADNLTCFKCSSRGHKADECPHIVDEEYEDKCEGRISTPLQENNSSQEFPPLISNLEKTLPTLPSKTMTAPSPNAPQQQKRSPSTLDSLSTTNSEKDLSNHPKPSNSTQIKLVQMNAEKSTPSAKRLKTQETIRPPLILTSDEISRINDKFDFILMNKPIDCQVTAKEFVDFLPTVRHSTNKLELARSFTPDLHSLQFILDEVKPLVSSSAKMTITSLLKAIQGNILSNSPSHSDTE